LVFSLLFGAFSVPLEARADLLSSLFGSNVSANTDSPDLTFDKNSQSIALLQANISSISVTQNKKDKKNNDEIDENTNVNILSNSALVPATSSLTVSDGTTDSGGPSSDEISVYVIRKGDSISQIADMFSVSTNTILWANDMKKGDKLTEGDVLVILPVSGVKHVVLKGQTLKGLANKYSVDVSDIAGFNGIAEDAKLAIGDELIIPDAQIVSAEPEQPKTIITNPIDSIKTTLKVLIGYFINPVPDYKRKSQGLHGRNGVDLAAPSGTPIVASASGVVLLARKGYNGGYGNMVIIKHPNGTQTLYAHQSKIATSTGAQVSQGEVIGYVGSTGHSTGPHLHFEVYGARNPAVDL
jgi:LysM repeat protein